MADSDPITGELSESSVGKGTLYQRSGGVFSVNFVLRGVRHRKSLHTRDRREAWIRARQVINAAGVGRSLNKTQERKRRRYVPPVPTAEWGAIVEQGSKAKGWLWHMYRRAAHRASQQHRGFRITFEDIVKVANRSNGLCEASGIPFSWNKVNGSTIGPYAPSLDRIEPVRGYGKGNIRLVCNCVNAAMGSWGEEVLFAIATALRP